VLAGVGNIQAIEALWKAKIDPRSRASALTAPDIRALERALHWTIERTLKDLAKGEQGAKNPFQVYGRKGEPCPHDGTPFQRIELAGRTTTFCPTCQVRRG
jgi:formamidopyrimidine-DNA glycosylase